MAVSVEKSSMMGLRIAEVLLLVFATILVAIASGHCTYMPYQGYRGHYCDSELVEHLSIGCWAYAYPQLLPIQGQFFVFISTLILILLSIGTLITKAAEKDERKPKLLGTIVSALGIFLCLLNGCLETWYTTGFSRGIFGAYGGYNQSWAAASAFYFLTAFVYVGDMIVTRKDKPDEHGGERKKRSRNVEINE